MTDASRSTNDWLNQEARLAFGKSLRDTIPRSVHANWTPPANRADAVTLLEESNQGRLPELIPLRYGRMLKSPLAFLRGSAIVMAADLDGMPSTNLRLQICGDCHLQNFGWFASAERNLVFDVNDFDETSVAPWEWDVKRLVASVILAARRSNASKGQQQQLGQTVAEEYRTHLAEYAAFGPLEMWYVQLDPKALLDHAPDVGEKGRIQQLVDMAHQKTLDKALPKMTERVLGQLRFKDHLPLFFHPPQLDDYMARIQRVMSQYRGTLSDERRVLLDRYRAVDVASKVVGVGSVGLRCGIILMLDPDESPLVLQIKEARASVPDRSSASSDAISHGHRIVHGQRVLQATSDIFLGWGNDTDGRAYYIRQLRDMKMSVDVEQMPLSELDEYCRMCGWALARAHAKAGDAAKISGYLGSGTQFDEALGQFGMAYASQVEQDFAALQAAAKLGRIIAKTDDEFNAAHDQ